MELYDSKVSLPNKLLQKDGTITDITGKAVVNSVEAYKSKPALPNKFLNPDGTYSTLNEIISGMIDTDLFIIVDELPESGDEQKIYLVPNGEGGFIEYHWTGDTWDPIGTIEIDLSDYVKNTDYATSQKGGVFKGGNGIYTSANGQIYIAPRTWMQYQTDADTYGISKGTLENIITGKELINQTQLTNAIQESITQVLGGSY